MRTIRFISIVIMAALNQGCVSQVTLQHAMNTIDLTWQEENRNILQENGARVYAVSRVEAFTAAQAALRRLGMIVEQQDPSTGFLYASAPAPTPLSAAEWETVKAADTPRMKQIAAQEIGILGWVAELNPVGFDVLMNAFIREKENGIEIALAVGLRSKAPPPPGGARGTSA